jgi:hypothetical protein
MEFGHRRAVKTDGEEIKACFAGISVKGPVETREPAERRGVFGKLCKAIGSNSQGK